MLNHSKWEEQRVGEQRVATEAYEDMGEAGVVGAGGGCLGDPAASERAADRVADVASGPAEAACTGAGD